MKKNITLIIMLYLYSSLFSQELTKEELFYKRDRIQEWILLKNNSSIIESNLKGKVRSVEKRFFSNCDGSGKSKLSESVIFNHFGLIESKTYTKPYSQQKTTENYKYKKHISGKNILDMVTQTDSINSNKTQSYITFYSNNLVYLSTTKWLKVGSPNKDIGQSNSEVYYLNTLKSMVRDYDDKYKVSRTIYNDMGKIIKEITFASNLKDSINNEALSNSIIEYEYDIKGNLIKKFFKQKDNDVWIDKGVVYYQYNENSDLIYETNNRKNLSYLESTDIGIIEYRYIEVSSYLHINLT